MIWIAMTPALAAAVDRLREVRGACGCSVGKLGAWRCGRCIPACVDAAVELLAATERDDTEPPEPGGQRRTQ